ncbi:hypothetical protein [Hymenobacter fodinae]|uniref:YcxB family protein n=1 Tax=Hymenobacter fodinae TaxID=2510796 RepID=A0A4Z0P9H4_9BACT|nr:hypothetical protein [Hymenobacter fodinae]TGE08087.1 hypothetical protein EU556_10140 [Hymenobacter fodinae]
MHAIHIAPHSITFTDYQAIHQLQQRQRYPGQAAPKPVTSDYWRKKGQLWIGSVASMGAAYWGLGPGKWLAAAIVVTMFTGLGLTHQWFEYRRAFRQHAQSQPATGFELTADTVIIRQGSHCRTVRWQDFYSIQHVSDWLLLYTSVEHCYYLNLQQVQPPNTAADVLGLLPKSIPAE